MAKKFEYLILKSTMVPYINCKFYDFYKKKIQPLPIEKRDLVFLNHLGNLGYELICITYKNGEEGVPEYIFKRSK
jgi:hypothetical protein